MSLVVVIGVSHDSNRLPYTPLMATVSESGRKPYSPPREVFGRGLCPSTIVVRGAAAVQVSAGCPHSFLPRTRSSVGAKGTRLISFRRHRPRAPDARSDETPRKRSCSTRSFTSVASLPLAPVDAALLPHGSAREKILRRFCETILDRYSPISRSLGQTRVVGSIGSARHVRR